VAMWTIADVVPQRFLLAAVRQKPQDGSTTFRGTISMGPETSWRASTPALESLSPTAPSLTTPRCRRTRNRDQGSGIPRSSQISRASWSKISACLDVPPVPGPTLLTRSRGARSVDSFRQNCQSVGPGTRVALWCKGDRRSAATENPGRSRGLWQSDVRCARRSAPDLRPGSSPYGTVADHAEVSPDSKPSENSEKKPIGTRVTR